MALAQQWHELLDAPRKELIVIDGAGHRPQFERPAEFVALMRRESA
jgi:pimeloyl-ACP methyl ester carboxylesterase